MFAMGGCDAYVGRKLDGKTCPPKDPPKKSKKKKTGKGKKAAADSAS